MPTASRSTPATTPSTTTKRRRPGRLKGPHALKRRICLDNPTCRDLSGIAEAFAYGAGMSAIIRRAIAFYADHIRAARDSDALGTERAALLAFVRPRA